MTAPPMAYFGGKTRLAQRIVGLLPAHEHYVEPYAGSLAVLLAKPPSRMETVSDLDGDLMCWWRVLRDRPDELARVCALTPHSRAEHQAALDADLTTLPDLERARLVWVRLTQGRGSQMRAQTGWRHYIDRAGSSIGMPGYLRAYVDRIAPCAERLQHVSLESRPALDLITSYGRSSSACLYVDPPYVGSARGGGYRSRYRVDMPDEASHRALLDALLACRASVVLSGYPSQLYDTALAGWDRIEIPTTTAQGGSSQARTEVLWSNREISHPTLDFEAVG